MKFLHDLIYPSFCLHCNDRTEQTLFCAHCLEHFQFLSYENRCKRCFSSFVSSQKSCLRCHFSHQNYEHVILFERNEMTRILYRSLQRENLGMYQLVASLFVVRIYELNWNPSQVRCLSKCGVCQTLKDEITRIWQPKKKKTKEILYIQEGNHSLDTFLANMQEPTDEIIRIMTFIEEED